MKGVAHAYPHHHARRVIPRRPRDRRRCLRVELLPDPIVQVSGTSPFVAGCDPGPDGVAYLKSEVEPWLDVTPASALNMVGVW
jgi:hypothetical protein